MVPENVMAVSLEAGELRLDLPHIVELLLERGSLIDKISQLDREVCLYPVEMVHRRADLEQGVTVMTIARGGLLRIVQIRDEADLQQGSRPLRENPAKGGPAGSQEEAAACEGGSREKPPPTDEPPAAVSCTSVVLLHECAPGMVKRAAASTRPNLHRRRRLGHIRAS